VSNWLKRRTLAWITVAVLVLAYFIYTELTRETPWQQAYKRHLASTPSTDNLPKIKVVEPDQLMIVDDFGPYVPGRAGMIKRIPPAPRAWWPQAYGVRYALPGARESASNVDPHIDVEVRDYPNASWAKYDSVEEQLSRGLVDVSQPVKLGYHLYGRATVYQGKLSGHYFWVSENKLVTVEFYSADPDTVLSGYLEKFPPPPSERLSH